LTHQSLTVGLGTRKTGAGLIGCLDYQNLCVLVIWGRDLQQDGQVASIKGNGSGLNLHIHALNLALVNPLLAAAASCRLERAI
jgi:hypothetical protein